LGFGLWIKKSEALDDCGADDLLLTGNKLLDKFIRKKILKTDKYSIERQIAILEAEQELLESFQMVDKKYVPYLLMELKAFIKQLKSRLQGLLKSKYLDNTDQVNHVETFNPGDRKNIKKYFDKVGQYINTKEDFDEYRERQIFGTYREKVLFLYQWVGVIRKYFSKKELEIAYGLFAKLNLPASFDEPQETGDDGESLILYDILGDNKNVSSEEHLSWAALFAGVFKHEFDAVQMKEFLECIPRHFHEYPPKYDDAGNFGMAYYSKQQLFKTFCISAGIEEEQKMREMFLVKIKKVIDNINRIRNELRSKP
jgi:hypothetical protein